MRLCLGFLNGNLKIINLQNIAFKIKHFLNSKLQMCFGSINPILEIDKESIIIGLKKRTFRVFCLKNGKLLSSIECCDEDFKDLCFFLSSEQLVFVITKNFIYIWKKKFLEKWKLSYKILCKTPIDLISKIPESNLLLTSCKKSFKIDVWDTFDNSLFFCGKIKIQEKIVQIEGSLCSRCFLVQTQKYIHIYTDGGFNFVSLPEIGHDSSYSGFSRSLVKFYDKNMILTSSMDRKLFLWDLRVKKIIAQWKGHVMPIKKIDTIDSRPFLSGYSFISWDTSDTVKIWDLRKNYELYSFKFYSNSLASFKLI